MNDLDPQIEDGIGSRAAPEFPETKRRVSARTRPRPAWLGERLIAIGEVRHAGQMTSVSRGEVRNAAGALIASATGTFMYLPVPGGPKPVMEQRDETERWKTS